MSYTDVVICTEPDRFLETWPPIYRGRERTVKDILRVSQVNLHVYSRYTSCLTDFTFEFIRHPIPPILSPSSRTFVELTLVIHNVGNLFQKPKNKYRTTFTTLCMPLVALSNACWVAFLPRGNRDAYFGGSLSPFKT
jgi:hypothetical protein